MTDHPEHARGVGAVQREIGNRLASTCGCHLHQGSERRIVETQAHPDAEEDPLSRQSLADLTERACQDLGKPISRSTVKRILDADAIKPWQYEQWIFPRAPDFLPKAARAQGERVQARSAANAAAGRPRALSAVVTMLFASSPAVSYIRSGVS